MAETNGVKNITDEEFEGVTGNGVSLVDFWAPWCHPCRLQGPILEKVAEDLGEKAQICKMNVDEHRETAMKHGITSIPTLLVFKDGQKIEEFIGVQQKEHLISTLQSHM